MCLCVCVKFTCGRLINVWASERAFCVCIKGYGNVVFQRHSSNSNSNSFLAQQEIYRAKSMRRTNNSFLDGTALSMKEDMKREPKWNHTLVMRNYSRDHQWVHSRQSFPYSAPTDSLRSTTTHFGRLPNEAYTGSTKNNSGATTYRHIVVACDFVKKWMTWLDLFTPHSHTHTQQRRKVTFIVPLNRTEPLARQSNACVPPFFLLCSMIDLFVVIFFLYIDQSSVDDGCLQSKQTVALHIHSTHTDDPANWFESLLSDTSYTWASEWARASSQ